MKILIEENTFKNLFDKEFIDALSEQDYTIDEVISKIKDRIFDEADMYPGITAAVEYGSKSIDKEVEEAVIQRLLEIQDDVMKENLDAFDIAEIIYESFWLDPQPVDEVEYNNRYYVSHLFDEDYY